MKVFNFFIDNFPSFKQLLLLFPISILWSLFSLYLAGICKQKWKWKTGYTRKLFHFLIFISAYFYQRYAGISAVFILGWSVTIVLIYAWIQNASNLFYEAIAREKDAPYRTKYIVFSYLATFLGGVLSNVFYGSYAIVGYVVTGIADAIAEPIGTRYGKHQYAVFSFDVKKKSYRSIEGSMAVFISSFIIMIVFQGISDFNVQCALLAFGIAMLCTLTEAFSPGGFDNFILQIVAAGLAFYFF
ncbi:MAG: hypothetical protein KA526_00715 [Chitinophagales bacterium]|nr:hypothetical protein [Chitinophagales bacterium]